MKERKREEWDRKDFGRENSGTAREEWDEVLEHAENTLSTCLGPQSCLFLSSSSLHCLRPHRCTSPQGEPLARLLTLPSTRRRLLPPERDSMSSTHGTRGRARQTLVSGASLGSWCALNQQHQVVGVVLQR